MSSLPTLSVIIPNYNHAKHLPASLGTLVNQSVQPLEVIVLDDASTDNSVEVIKQLAAQHPVIRLIQNEKNLGVITNINKGVDLARGEFVFVGSADDEILPGLFEKSLALLAKRPQAGLSCTVSKWCYVDSGLTWYMAAGMADRPTFLTPDDLVHLGKQGKLVIPTSSALMRKAALCDVGKFIPELRWHADWFACFAAAFRYGMCYVPEPLSQFNIYTKSFYSSGSKGEQHRQVLIKLADLLTSPAFADIRPRVRDSGALSLFAMPMLKVLWRRKEFRSLISWTLLRRTLRRDAELIGKKILPRSLQRWVLNRFYRQSQ